MLEMGAAGHGCIDVHLGLLGQSRCEFAYKHGNRLRMVAEVHLEKRRDLVVSRTAGAQPPPELDAKALEQSALEGGVDILIVWMRGELP